MSYMDFPSFSIAGSFYTDPSTMDNDPSHYDESCTNPSPWQDPGGSHFFSFQDILAKQVSNRPFTPPRVSAAYDKNGLPTLNDPLIGTPVLSVDSSGGITGGPFSPAKMIDLDVYQQAVSTIHGFFMNLSVGATTLIAAMDPTSLNSVRFDRVLPTRGWQPWDGYGAGSFGGDTNASGVFQSILRIPVTHWPVSSGSAILDQLRLAATVDLQNNFCLSIRFTLDGYQNVPYHSADFRIGRMLATVGPLLAGDPAQCIPGRWLAGRSYNGKTDAWNQPSLYGAPFRITASPTGSQLAIDLSNALMTSAPGADPLDLGNLSVYIGEGSTGVVGQPFQLNNIFYNMAGGIVRLPLTAAQASAAQSAPFFITSSRTDIAGLSTFKSQPVLWQESPTGTWIACSERNLQLPSDGPAVPSSVANIYLTQWGVPITNPQALNVALFPCYPGNGFATVPWSAGYVGNTASCEGALDLNLTCQSPGRFQLALSAAKDPGVRTPELDSQLYFIAFWPQNQPGPPPNLDPSKIPATAIPDFAMPAQEAILSCVIWAAYPLNTAAQFPEIAQIMKVYDKLFPAMHAKMDLCDEQTFRTFSLNPPWDAFYSNQPGPMSYTFPNGDSISTGTIPYYLTRSINDPRFMPIMRNLSPNKLLTVLYFCYNLQNLAAPVPNPPGFGYEGQA